MQTQTSVKCGLLWVVLVAAACHQPLASAQSGQPAPSSVPVLVKNSNTQDMKLYVANGGMRVRLGLAPALRATELRIPVVFARAVGGVELVAQPLGGGPAVAFPPITVNTNDRIVLNVQFTISQSSFAVYALDSSLHR